MSAGSTFLRIAEEKGVRIGSEMIIRDERCIPRMLARPDLEVGRTYVEGLWEAPDLVGVMEKWIKGGIPWKLRASPKVFWDAFLAKLVNSQTEERANMVAEHYNLSAEEFFELMLDIRTMAYTCGYFRHTNSLEEAQVAKFDLVCKKLELQRGDTVLDVGCGWGGLMNHMVENYGAVPTGTSVSEGQTAWAKKRYKHHHMDFRIEDYRSTTGQFDVASSIEMVEAVGGKNLPAYFASVHRCLRPGGFFLLQAIVALDESSIQNSWIEENIFRNGELPTFPKLERASKAFFDLLDDEELMSRQKGSYYVLTLIEWERRLTENKEIIVQRFGLAFYRKMRFYLLSCAAAFRARKIVVTQHLYARI